LTETRIEIAMSGLRRSVAAGDLTWESGRVAAAHRFPAPVPGTGTSPARCPALRLTRPLAVRLARAAFHPKCVFSAAFGAMTSTGEGDKCRTFGIAGRGIGTQGQSGWQADSRAAPDDGCDSAGSGCMGTIYEASISKPELMQLLEPRMDPKPLRTFRSDALKRNAFRSK